MTQIKSQIIESKAVMGLFENRTEKKGGTVFEGMSTEVIEKTCRKNVHFRV
jgi:hypothetical protein